MVVTVNITGGNIPIPINSTRKCKFWNVDAFFQQQKNEVLRSAWFPFILDSIKYDVCVLKTRQHLKITLIKGSAMINAVLPSDTLHFVFSAVNI